MLKKILFAAVIAATTATTALAVPARPGKQTVTQPDGTTVTLQTVGDERFHATITTDGLPVSRNAEGFTVYRLADGSLSDIAAHNPGERTSAEARFLEQNIQEVSLDKLRSNALKTKKHIPGVASTAHKAPSLAANAPMADRFTACPTSGKRKIPVIFVQYTDVKFSSSDPLTTFKTYFNEGTSSARQYFIDNSNGAYEPQFDLYGPVTLPQNQKYYGGNDYYGSDQRPGQMVADACTLLDNQINFKDYDTNGDGYVDAVIILYAGKGEQYSNDDLDDVIWPHKWELSSTDYGKTLTLDGVKIDNYGCFNELYGTKSDNSKKIDGIGVFCHEFSHALGLPDLYGTTSTSQNYYGMGSWSLMCNGCYNDDGYTPVGYTGYDKWFMGWVDLQEAQDNTRYTLPVCNTGDKANDQFIKITNPSDANEVVVIENHGIQGWDSGASDEGLLIYRVSYDYSTWFNNEVNNTSTGRYVPYCADNKASYYNENGDLWPNGNATELTATSSPAMKMYNGKTIDRPVTDITRNADGSISFWFAKGNLPGLSAPTLSAHSNVSATGFTANWAHTPEADCTYTLEVTEHVDLKYELVCSETFSGDDLGDFTQGGGYTIYDNGSGLRLGSGSQLGSIESPTFTLDESGTATVVLKAKYYNNDNSSVKVSLVNATGTEIAAKTQALTNGYTTYSIMLTGTPGTTVKVQIGTTAKKKRVYLESAAVYNGDASELANGAPAKAPAETGDATKRTITGITSLSHTVEGLTANGKFDYRVKAVPVDETAAIESQWSKKQTVDLSLSGIESIGSDASASEATVQWYNLQGIRVDGTALTPGIYIRRCGNKAEKIVVR